MKTVLVLILVLSVTTGCVMRDTAQNYQRSGGSSFDEPTSPPPMSSPSEQQKMGPQIVVPVTGGAPVVGIPLGGNLYQPVTGGPPVVGIPTSP